MTTCHECNGSGKGERDPSGAFAAKCPVCDGSGKFVRRSRDVLDEFTAYVARLRAKIEAMRRTP